MAERIVQVTSSIELMSPPGLHDVLKTLEHFGIYQRFECIKCHQDLSTINLALAHLRGEYLECKTGDVGESTLSAESVANSRKEKEVFAPRKPKKFSPKNIKKEVPSSSNKPDKHKKGSKYSLKQIEMILNKKKRDNVFAKQFGITTRDVSKLRYNWKKSHTYDNLLINEEVIEVPETPKKNIKHVHKSQKYSKPYKINKNLKGANDYKIQPGEDAP